MKLGIVGHEAAKFTAATEAQAKQEILDFICTRIPVPTLIVSGECHLGGVDIWAHEIADREGIEFLPCPPKNLQWEPDGYKERNLKIANNSDLVLCVVVKELPPDYKGMRFPSCYHCKDRNPPHVKSGGCWTAWKCKQHEWIII